MSVKIKLTGFVLGILLLISQTTSFASQADVQNIPPDQYSPTTLSAISQAKESVYLVMYLASLDPKEPNSEVSQLLKALVDAKSRGVRIKVVFDQNLDFTDEPGPNEIYKNKNQAAFEYLRQNNIEVFYDTAEIYTHAKAIVIDHETSIFGSTNWSKGALTKNNEVNAVVHSKEFAQNLINQFDQIKLQEYIPAVVTSSVKIPRDFLIKDNILGEIVTQSDERSLDVYLYLLGQYNQNIDAKVTINYDALAQSLVIDKMPKEDYRRQITKVLLKLKEKYQLIDFENPARNQNVEVTLKDVKNPKKNYDPQTDSFDLPTVYWKYHWNQSLSFSAKTMDLILLSYTSPSSPSFAISRENLSKDFHISESFISDGTKNLRIQNLLDIQYSSLEDQNYSHRQPNVYTPKLIYDPSELQKELQKLEQKYGKEKLQRAITVAAIVFEQNDPEIIKTLIDLEDQYGEAVIQEASGKIGDKNPDNPKRSAGYLINTIKSIANQT